MKSKEGQGRVDGGLPPALGAGRSFMEAASGLGVPGGGPHGHPSQTPEDVWHHKKRENLAENGAILFSGTWYSERRRLLAISKKGFDS